MDKITNKNSFVIILPCSLHPGEQISRGCTDLSCTSHCIYCPQCEKNDKFHSKEHRNRIRPISEVILNLSKELEKYMKDDQNPNSSLLNEMENNLKSMKKHLKEQKNKLEIDFKRVFENLIQNLKETQQKILTDIEKQYEIFVKNYEIFRASFSKTASFNPFENCSNSKTLASKLKSIKSIKEQSSFLIEMKQYLQEKQAKHSAFSNIPQKSKENDNIFKIEDLLKTQMKDKPTYNTPNFELISKKIQGFSEKIQKIIQNHIFFYPLKSAYIFSAFRNLKFPKGPENLHFEICNNSKTVNFDQETLTDFLFLNPKEPLETNHEKPIQNILAISNEILVTGASDNLLKLWDLNTKKCLKNLYGNTHYITCLSLFHLKNGHKNLPQIKDFRKKFSEYGFLLTNGSYDRNLVIWDSDFEKSTVNTTKFKILRGHDYYLTCMQELYNGENLITGDEKGFIMIWNILEYKSVFKSIVTKNSHRKAITSIVQINDSSRFVTTDLEGVLLVWELCFQRSLKNGLETISDCKIIHFIKGEYGGITQLIPRVSVKDVLVSAHENGKIIVWKFDEELKKIKSHVLIDDIQDSIHQISLIELKEKSKEFIVLCYLSQKHGVCAVDKDGKILAAIKFGTDEDLVSNSSCSLHKFQFVGNNKPLLCVANQSREKKNVNLLEINL